MHFDYTEEHEMFRDAARGYLEREEPIAAYRKNLTADPDYRKLSLSSDAAQGWPGMLAGDDGTTIVEAMVLSEELGRAAHPGAFPTLSTAAWSLARTKGGKHADLVGAISEGKTIVATPSTIEASLTAATSGSNYQLNGRLPLVQDADIASHYLARISVDGAMRQALIPASLGGITTRTAKTIDITRAWFDVSFDNVAIARDAFVEATDTQIQKQADMTAVLIGADSLGAAARLLDMTVAYTKERIAFGKPVAAFQAVKHRCAEMLIKLECGRVAVWYGALALRDSREDETEAAATAKFYATEAASWIAGEALQLHGAIGMTWEHDLHLFLKRAKMNELLFGTSSAHKETVARALQLGASARI